MNLRPALFVAALGLLAAAGPAAAQFAQQSPPPACQEFAKLNGKVETTGKALQAAGQRKTKPSPQEACKLFTSYSGAMFNLLKYVQKNDLVWCGVNPEVAGQLKAAHARTAQTRAQICRVAAVPPRPRGPSLSDALSAPVPNADNIKTGHGTFDTLTGTPLGK